MGHPLQEHDKNGSAFITQSRFVIYFVPLVERRVTSW